MKHKTQNTT